MANVKLPQRFINKLERDQKLDGIIKMTLFNFGEILKSNRLHFFSEYTDHGIDHIEKVIDAANNLITDRTFDNVLKETDIAYLILSIILHDLGMHLNLEGFKSLIIGEYDCIRNKDLDKLLWLDLWEDYLNEAKKFSGKQLKLLFGNENTVIRDPLLVDPAEINENDRKLIGEFIRRNHTRLAHEIAVKGFPGRTIVGFADGLDNEVKDMIGFIARSHGMELRDCVRFVESVYGRKNKRCPNDTHAVYLMVLLRIADYIQIDKGRTSKILIQLKTFSSPFSEFEHLSHLAIDNIDKDYQDDPESICIIASPKDSEMYLKLKKLISSIQYELDISWAVLGELYGMINAKPEIKYRRLSSNIEDEAFVAKQEYVAEQISFKANEELIKLLISPLYGEDPTFGVRELIQNAIDACREREDYEKRMGRNSFMPKVLVEVLESEGKMYFQITDNGIGMDINVIKNYFLSVGASYRKDINWQNEFIDKNGISRINRSGRFGIGLLAAFLIGEEFYIETKNPKSKFGYRFYASLYSEKFNILKDSSIKDGTVIKIKITPQILNKFKQDDSWYKWYTLPRPLIEYYLNDQKMLPYATLDPDLNEILPLQWNAFDSEGFNKIFWTYYAGFSNVMFSCNGILIRNAETPLKKSHLELGVIRNAPKLSVFDPNAYLPLSLDRNSFTKVLPFSIDLKTDIYKDFIALLLVSNPASFHANILHVNQNKIKHTGDLFGANILMFSKHGYILSYAYFIEKLSSLKTIVLTLSENADIKKALDISLDISDRYVLIESRELLIESEQTYELDLSKFIRYLKSSAGPITKKNDMLTALGWTLFSNTSRFNSLIPNQFLLKYTNQLSSILECKIKKSKYLDKELNSLLQKYIGDDVVIPYELEDRKKKFPFAFKDLERYMKKYQGQTSY